MNKDFLILSVLTLLILTGCATSETFENSFDYGDLQTTSAVLSAPNISAQHVPPLIFGVAYLEVYENEVFCQKEKGLFGERHQIGEPIGTIYAHKKQRVNHGEIPVGQVIIKAGFRTGSFGDEGLKCSNYFSFETKAEYQYEVEVKESRPLVTQCYFSIKEKDSTGAYTELTDFEAGKERGFLRSKDLSDICKQQR